ncbi:MAG: minor capsid protein [Oscillospiraceae bacterium]|jgi:hypothetical protein|nr:minor capsid protein [Oscillospiraceae bacterium]
MKLLCDTKTKFSRLSEAAANTQEALTKVALDDCQRYCKVDSGKLRDSAKAYSNFDAGRLIWHADYARAAYYIGEASRNKNPLAAKMWAHTAAGIHKKEWLGFTKTKLIAENKSGK